MTTNKEQAEEYPVSNEFITSVKIQLNHEQKIYNSIQEALMDYARLGANDRKERAKKVLYAYMDVEKDLSQPKILIHTFKELINQLQVSPGVIYCGDVLELCEELKKL